MWTVNKAVARCVWWHVCPWGLLSPKSYVDVPAGPRKSDYLYTNFLPNFPPISIPFSKAPNLTKLGAFYNNLPQIHPIYVIWAPSSLMKTPDRSTKFREKVPQKAGTYTYTMSLWEPPGTCDGFEASVMVKSWRNDYKVGGWGNRYRQSE